jgi:hypothetical protein
VLDVELLLLVRGHAALAQAAHAIALHGLGQDDGRLAGMGDGRGVGGVQLARVVAAAAQAVDVGVRQIRDQRRQFGVLRRSARGCRRRRWPNRSGTGRRLSARTRAAARRHIAGEQQVPVRAPQHLDHVPAGAGEQGFELIDDAAVAAHRAVQALQIAVDDEGQIVEALAGGQTQRADRLRLVHLAVAEEAPDAALAAVAQAAVVQIAQEARLVDRIDPAQAHRAGGELPEARHQPGMRIRAQARPPISRR